MPSSYICCILGQNVSQKMSDFHTMTVGVDVAPADSF